MFAFFVRFFCRRFVRFNGANYSASMSSFSLSKIDGQTQLIKSKLFIPCLACANFVMVILLLAIFWCSVTMFTKLQFLISNFGTAGVLSLSITVASHQRRILSIKQDIMVFLTVWKLRYYNLSKIRRHLISETDSAGVPARYHLKPCKH